MPTPLQSLLFTYLSELKNQAAQTGTTGELSYRDYLGKFLRGAAEALNKTGAAFTGEVSNAWGRPDYEVSISGTLGAIGYVEAEAISADLARLAGHAKHQNDRFKQNLHNFLLTNHYDFRLFVDGSEVERATLPSPSERGAVTISSDAESAMERLLERFLSEAAPIAVSPEGIARQLAKRARLLRVAAGELLALPESALHPLWQSYQEALSIEMDAPTFADVYAQTFTYGLFLAWFSFNGATFDRQAAMNALPRAVPPIRALLRYGNAELPDDLLWIVDGICADLNRADKEAARRPFQNDKRDPMVHFYETFLAAYDPKLRESRGSYYTPDAVVDFIVRAVDDVLRRDFNKGEGLADASVRLLDPATGTGTFLARAYQQVREQMEKAGDAGLWADRARTHLAKHFYGFELLPTAYTLAHLKLRQVLAEEGAGLLDSERLPVYLTNTLDDEVPPQQQLLLAKELSDEVRAADKVKKQEQILVVLGNPPYAGHSSNPNRDKEGKLTFIGELMEDYKRGFPELNKPAQGKWLQDDYVKFLRFAQWMIGKNGSGVVAFVTNHSYLDNPTFRGMRLSLMQTFDEIFLLDLHGNSKRKETAPDGSKDENVFDIQQGVAVCLMIKRPDTERKNNQAVVHHADLFGLRSRKYVDLLESRIFDTPFTVVNPTEPVYLFIPMDEQIKQSYEKGWSVKDIFNQNGDPAPGFVSTHDQFAISFTKEEAITKVEKFLITKTEEEARALFQLCTQDQWQYSRAKSELETGTWREEIVHCAYRPFDLRWTVFNRNVSVHRRERVSQHILGHENYVMLIGPNGNVIGDAQWNILSVTNTVVDYNYYRRGGAMQFPLYLYPRTGTLEQNAERRPNLSPAFLDALRSALTNGQEPDTDDPTKNDPTPEAIFHYIYAVLHAPTYRARYAEFLKRDFPRVPLPPSRAVFDEAAQIGEKLVALHLLENPALNQHGIGFPVAGDHAVQKMRANDRYSPHAQRVHLNAVEYFDHVPQEAWEFRVGGYQPAAKWLDDRANRTLTEDDIRHYRRLIAALRETARLLPDADAVFAQILASP